VALAVLPSQAGAGLAGGTNQIWFVHGIGNDPGDNEFDVYQRQVGSGDPFSLLIDGDDGQFTYGDTYDTGSAEAGDYDVLVCTADGTPDPTIDSCADNGENAVNGNSGNVVTIVDAPFMSLFIGYGAVGRPEVLPFVPNVDCVATPTTGRLTAAHGADADPVDVFLDETLAFADLANGESQQADVPAAPYHVEITDGAALDIDVLGFLVDGGINRMAFVTGDPDDETDYAIITQDYVVETCEQPTTTSTSTTTTAQAQELTRPRFTG
jgi:hypothetical protein